MNGTGGPGAFAARLLPLLFLLLLLPIAAPAADFPYREGFENADSLRWETRGGWHRTAAPETVRVAPAVRESLVTFPDDGWWPAAPEGNACLAVAEESTGVYVVPWDPAAQSAGNGGASLAARRDTAWSPVIFAPPGSEVRLRFLTWWEVESVGLGAADWMNLEFSNDSGATYAALATMIGPTLPPSPEDGVPFGSNGYGASPVWEERAFDCSTGAEGEIRFRLIFDTTGPDRNGFRGWFIDDFQVSCDSLFPPYGLDASDTLCGRVRLAWSDSSSSAAVLHAVARRPAGTGAYATVADSIPADSLAWTDTSAADGTVYDYVVYGFNTCGPSGYSASDSGLAPGTPDPPGAFAASDTACAGVRLSWTASDGAVAYRVFRNDTLLAVLDAGETAWLDDGVARDSAHAYRVDAAGWCDTSSSAPDSGARRALPPPPAAVSVEADSVCGAIAVVWDTVARDVTRWVVYRDEDSVAAVPRGGEPRFADASADSLITHSYTVRGWNDCGFSGPAGPALATRIGLPPSPDSLRAGGDLCVETILEWFPSPDPGLVERWVIYRNGDSLGAAPADTIRWADDTGEADSAYQYAVRAWNRCGYSLAAAVDSGLRGGEPPLPASFAASDTLCDAVELTWTAVEGDFLRYVLFRDDDSVGAVAAGAAPVFHDSSAVPMSAALYSLRTRSACGLSADSLADEGMRRGSPPSPAGCESSDSLCGRVRIAWTAGAGPGLVERYVIYRGDDSVGVRSAEPFVFNHTGAAANEPALYRVRAWSRCGLSAAAEDSGVSLSAPSAPSGFTASRDLCRSVELNWSPPVEGGPVWEYVVVRAGEGGWTEILPGDSLRFFDGDAPAEAVYTIRARNCEESPAAEDTGRTIEAAPAPPAEGTASVAGCDSVDLAWTAAPDAGLGYLLFRNGAGPVDSVGPGTIAAGVGSVEGGVDHLFTVRSVNACGRSVSACSLEIRIPGPIDAAPPGACSATVDSCEGVTVRWNWTSPDIEWYRVTRVRDGFVFADVPAGTDSLLDGTIAPGDTSYYRVLAGNRCFAAAAPCSARGARAAPPAAPNQCSASNNRCGSVRVYWYWDPANIGDELTEFRIYRKPTPSSQPFTLVGTAPPGFGALTFDDTGPNVGTDYLYRVAAANRCGGAYGNCLAVGGAIGPPGAVEPVAPADGAADLERTVLFTWDADPGAVAVRLEVARDPLFDSLVVDSLVTGDEAEIDSFEFYRSYRWRLSGWNNCGEGPASAVRVFSLGIAPGLELAAGPTRIPFGDGADTTFADTVLVLENGADQSLDWFVADPEEWVHFEPSSGALAPSATESVRVRPGPFRCGVVYRESLFIDTDPVPPGRLPIGLDLSLAPPPRPAGDVDWDCEAEMEDALLLLEALLGVFVPSEEESTGADANGDGRINVADVVLLGRNLAAGGPVPPAGTGKVEFSCAAAEEPVIRLTAPFPVRAARVRFLLEEGDPAAVAPVDPSRTIVAFDREEGALGVFFFETGPVGARERDLLRVLPGAGGEMPVLRPEAVELIGAGGEKVSLRLGAAALRPSAAPARLLLAGARPNPFNAFTTVEYALPTAGPVRLVVHDVRGARVRTLVDGPRDAGAHGVVWNGRDDAGRPVASGIYFLRVQWNGESRAKRIALIR